MRSFKYLALLAAFVLGISVPTYAAKGPKAKENSKNKLSANVQINQKLSPIEGGPADLASASGRIKYSRNRGQRSIKASLKLVLPALSLSIPDSSAAASAAISLELLRDDVAYATCSLVFVAVEEEAGEEGQPGVTSVKFRLHAEQKRRASSIRNKKGSCAEMPSMQKGDSAVIHGIGTDDLRLNIVGN